MSDAQGGHRRPTDEEIAAATPRGTGSKEAQVGAFVLIGLISFVLVLFWMTDPATLRGRYMLVTEVGHAGGVRSGDPIQMQGVNVGRVHDFEMVDDNRVVITMEIEGNWQIPMGSSTIMGEAGLFGGRALEIVRGPGPGVYAEGDTLAGVGAGGGGLLSSVDQLSARAESVLGSIDAMLSDETVGSVQGTARELESLLTELSAIAKEQRGALTGLTETLSRAAEGLEAASAAGPDIASAMARADSAMVVLTATGESLDVAMASLSTVLGRMERGEGTLGRLSTDETLYLSLNSAAENLSTLLADLQANPKKYINISIF
ncbi:MAG: MlaD family protein [Gemmatimonadetes bacterium]|nr:MlaD family protein [Gemmatimonadota bacterium]MDA1103216.1 MlaD family protein [Gemmatimonadota bacterium]